MSRFILWTSLVAQMVKNLPAMQETWIRSLGWEDPLKKEMATHSSIHAWRIPWTEEPGGLVYRVAKSQIWLSNQHFQVHMYPSKLCTDLSNTETIISITWHPIAIPTSMKSLQPLLLKKDLESKLYLLRVFAFPESPTGMSQNLCNAHASVLSSFWA